MFKAFPSHNWRLELLLVSAVLVAAGMGALADCEAVSPTPAGPPGNPADTSDWFPFLLKQVGWSSMRYQQVYPASDFVCDSSNIYVTSVAFRMDHGGVGLIRNMQINLSTTQRGGTHGDNLSTNFVENVGADDTVVFGPAPHYFDYLVSSNRVFFDRPFLYNPAMGNLLLDVRIYDGAGEIDVNDPYLDAQNAQGDGTSRVYAPSVNAAFATYSDTIGLSTIFRFHPIPSLQIRVESVLGTNRPVIRWPAQPSVFLPQMSAQLGSNAFWQMITTGVGGSPAGPDRWIYLPVEPPGDSAFYRLVWQGAQAASLGK